MVIESASVLDAVYMTVITITTVGFEEVIELSAGGKVLTIVIILFGVGAALYTAGIALEVGLERLTGGERRRRRMVRDIERISDHVVLCGWDRVGEHTYRALMAGDVPTVVVDRDPSRVALAEDAGVMVITGEAAHDDVLVAAGIDRARALIACVREDSDNLVIVLSARHRRPDLMIIARASDPESQQKLRLAGADRVVSPQLVGAVRLAALAAQPGLEEYVDLIHRGRLVELQIAECPVAATSPVAGRVLRDSGIREHSGAMVIAIEEQGGGIDFNPEAHKTIRPGDRVIGLGSEEQLARLRDHLGS